MIKFNEKDVEEFESKVENVMKILQSMSSNNKVEQEEGLTAADRFLKGDSHLQDEENFIVKVRENRTVINNTNTTSNTAYSDGSTEQMDAFTFMQQMEKDCEKRAESRKNREEIAQNLRKLGNEAFRKNEFEKAIKMYTKALDHVKDSSILYNNRALSYIRLGLARRAIIDCDFVINKLDEKNQRAWLYRAAAYYNLADMKNYEKCVKTVKKNHSKDIEKIDKFLIRMKEGGGDIEIHN